LSLRGSFEIGDDALGVVAPVTPFSFGSFFGAGVCAAAVDKAAARWPTTIRIARRLIMSPGWSTG